jgi:hypothetical protein
LSKKIIFFLHFFFHFLQKTPISKIDIPVLQEISIAHGCKNTSKEFWELMVSDYNEHCFTFHTKSDLHCITGFVICANNQILELVTGYKYKKERYWLLRACKESHEYGTILKFTMSKQFESEMQKELKNQWIYNMFTFIC